MTTWLARLSGAAPVLGLAAMLVLPLVLRENEDDPDLVLTRNAMLQEAVRDVPYQLGDWVGEDVKVQTAAIKLLRPNAVFSREYTRLRGGPKIQLLLVHCSDARDMSGHYPPVCYPANGWVGVDPEDDVPQVEATVMGESVRMRLYTFRQRNEWGVEHTIRVYNYFLLPNGETTIDLEVVRKLVERSGFSAQGVAQVQLVMGGEGDPDASLAAAEDLLNAASSLLGAFGQGERAQG